MNQVFCTQIYLITEILETLVIYVLHTKLHDYKKKFKHCCFRENYQVLKIVKICILYQLFINVNCDIIAGSGESKNSRRGSGESARSRRDSVIAGQTPSPCERKHNCRHHRRRQSQQSVDGGGVTPTKYYRSDQRPSASSTDSAASNAVRSVWLMVVIDNVNLMSLKFQTCHIDSFRRTLTIIVHI